MNHAVLELQPPPFNRLAARMREPQTWALLIGLFAASFVAMWLAGCSAVSYSPPVLGGGYSEVTTIKREMATDAKGNLTPGNLTIVTQRNLQQSQNAKTPSTLSSKGLDYAFGIGADNTHARELSPEEAVSLGTTTPATVTIPPPPDYTKYILIGAGILITLIGVGLAGASAYPAFILFAPLLRSIGTDFGIFGAALILVGVFTKELEGLVWFLGAGIVIVLIYVAYTKLSAHKATLTAAATSNTASTTTTTSTTASPAASTTVLPISVASPLASDAATALKNVEAGLSAVAAKVESLISTPKPAVATVTPVAAVVVSSTPASSLATPAPLTPSDAAPQP